MSDLKMHISHLVEDGMFLEAVCVAEELVTDLERQLAEANTKLQEDIEFMDAIQIERDSLQAKVKELEAYKNNHENEVTNERT
jgi:hypothetical protein